MRTVKLDWSGTMGAVLGLLIAALFAPLISAGFGALAGEVTSWFFPTIILETLGRFGINIGTGGLRHLELWHVGAMLGFIASFFRTNVSLKD